MVLGTIVTATGNTITIDGSGIGTLTIGTDNGSIVVNTSTTISGMVEMVLQQDKP